MLAHPFVVGELALGQMRQRGTILAALQALPAASVAKDAEVLGLIDRAGLAGRGIGYLDAHLLAACLLTPARLWTRDRALAQAAAAQDLALAEPGG